MAFHSAFRFAFRRTLGSGHYSIKYHLKRVIEARTLTFEELSTLLHQLSACLNSRPIAAFLTISTIMLL